MSRRVDLSINAVVFFVLGREASFLHILDYFQVLKVEVGSVWVCLVEVALRVVRLSMEVELRKGFFDDEFLLLFARFFTGFLRRFWCFLLMVEMLQIGK